MGDKETVGPEKRDSGPLASKVREELNVLREKAKEDLQALKKPGKTQLFKSMFRVKHDDSERSRALSVLTNVFLHLHPAKVNRDAVRYGFTWGMGGITFYLFIVLTFTGVLLMRSEERRVGKECRS